MDLIPTERYEDHLFDDLVEENGRVNTTRILKRLKDVGIIHRDPRLKETVDKIREIQSRNDTATKSELSLDRDEFYELIHDNIDIIQRAFVNELIIPDFAHFCHVISQMYDECARNRSGNVASYIPQLARADPTSWGVSVCSIDGQRHFFGETKIPFSIQSACKPLNYALALNSLGSDVVHRHVGHEPSGESFNQIKLGYGNKPHNPMINAGAIVIASLLKNDLMLADRFDWAQRQYSRLAGDTFIGFNNSVFLSERETADRNFALAYYMQENGCFPEGASLKETLDFYFQLCSMEINCESGSVIAATLANGGICPITGDKILDGVSVRNTLSLMHSCGMYDYSGEFSFKVGLPAKSGVSGVIMLVVPNVAGFCLWSPPLDNYGNSVRAVQFCELMLNYFNFHHLDNLRYGSGQEKLNPCCRIIKFKGTGVVKLLFNSANGDLGALQRMYLAGNNMSVVDYDGRSALHLAAAEGHLNCVRFLLETCHVPLQPKDRWDQTPFDDALKHGRVRVVSYLENFQKDNTSVGI